MKTHISESMLYRSNFHLFFQSYGAGHGLCRLPFLCACINCTAGTYPFWQKLSLWFNKYIYFQI